MRTFSLNNILSYGLFFSFIGAAICPVLLSGQEGDGFQAAKSDFLETEHYRIHFEPKREMPRPTPEEIGEMLEQFAAIMNRTVTQSVVAAKQKAIIAKKKSVKEKGGTSIKKSPKPERSENIVQTPSQKMDIYFFNDQEGYDAKLATEGHKKTLENQTGCFYEPTSKTLYLLRQPTIYQTRSALIREMVYVYQIQMFPGVQEGYPKWFAGTLPVALSDHAWTKGKLTLGIQPPFLFESLDKRAFTILKEFRDWVKEKHPVSAVEDAEEDSTGKKTAKKIARSNQPPESVIEPGMIEEFLKEKADAQEKEKNTEEQTLDENALFWVIGKYLLNERNDAICVILAEMSINESLENQPDPNMTKEAFEEAFEKAFEKSPLTIESIGRWLIEHPIPWRSVLKEWQFNGEEFLCKATGGALLVYQTPDQIPPFIAKPLVGECILGLVLNFSDKDNYDSIRVQLDRRVAYTQKRNGTWGEPKQIAELPNRGGVMGPQTARFAVRFNGDLTEVSIDGILVFSDVFPEGKYFGMLLEGKDCEASFLPKP